MEDVLRSTLSARSRFGPRSLSEPRQKRTVKRYLLRDPLLLRGSSLKTHASIDAFLKSSTSLGGQDADPLAELGLVQLRGEGIRPARLGLELCVRAFRLQLEAEPIAALRELGKAT